MGILGNLSMGISYLVVALQNEWNQLFPKDYNNCPRYNHDGIKIKCIASKTCVCMGIDEESIVRKIGDKRYIVQCNYWCD